MVINVTCNSCKKTFEITVKDEDYIRYQNGEHAQRCFPYLTAGERELIISQTCDTCFNEMFPDE